MENLDSFRLFAFQKGEAYPSLETPENLTISRCRLFQYLGINQIWTFNRKKIWERIRRGDRCYLAYLNKIPVHYSWVQLNGLHYIKNIDQLVPVGRTNLVIYHCRTAGEARGINIYPLVLQHILKEHFNKSFTRAWIYTSQDNIPSHKGIIKAGFKSVKDIPLFLSMLES